MPVPEAAEEATVLEKTGHRFARVAQVPELQELEREVVHVEGDVADALPREPVAGLREVLRPESRANGRPRPHPDEGQDEGDESWKYGWLDLGVASGNPLYVLEIRGDQRQVVVGSGEQLYSPSLRAKRLNWISIDDLREPMRIQARIRNRHAPAEAVIEKTAEDEVLATFDEPQRAVTPGQAAVFYRGTRVLGGCWIQDRL